MPTVTEVSTGSFSALKHRMIAAMGISAMMGWGRLSEERSSNSSAESCIFRLASSKSLPCAVNFLALHSSQTKIIRNSAAVAIREGRKAAVAVVPKLFMAMVF